jgi:hypothetical protein
MPFKAMSEWGRRGPYGKLNLHVRVSERLLYSQGQKQLGYVDETPTSELKSERLFVPQRCIMKTTSSINDTLILSEKVRKTNVGSEPT